MTPPDSWPQHQLFHLTLPARPSAVGLAGATSSESAQCLGFPARCATQLRLAVEEAVSNVVQHAYQGEGLVEVRGERLGSGVKIHVRDWGLPLYDLPESASHGLHRIQELTNKVELKNLGRGGKEVVLHKQPVPGVKQRAEQHDGPETEVEVREMTDDDAPHVCECFYSGYGYSYAYADLYYPERLMDMIRSGHLDPVVSSAASGKIVGFSSLVQEHPDDSWGELAMAIVDPHYRGHHLFARMFERLTEKARAKGLQALFAHAVSVHPISQHVLHKLGMSDTAVLLGFAPPTDVSRALDDQRQTFVLQAMRLHEVATQPVFYPGRHAKMIGELLSPLGYEPEFREHGEAARGHSVMTTSVSQGLNIGTICFQEIGQDAAVLLARTLRQLCLRHVDVVQLYLPLRSPALVSLLPSAESDGFFFAGVHPGWNGEDALVLQYLNNFEIDPSSIWLEYEKTKTLLEYVFKCQIQSLNKV